MDETDKEEPWISHKLGSLLWGIVAVAVIAATGAASVRECPPDSEGYQPSAYDSRLARMAMGLPESSEQTLAMASDH
jgi:hypothetical protein